MINSCNTVHNIQPYGAFINLRWVCQRSYVIYLLVRQVENLINGLRRLPASRVWCHAMHVLLPAKQWDFPLENHLSRHVSWFVSGLIAKSCTGMFISKFAQD